MVRKNKKVQGGNRDLLKTVQPNAAGIDLGSREHWVAVPPLPDGSPNVERFGTTTPELLRLAGWLGRSILLPERIPLFEILDSRGFEVHLVNHAKSVMSQAERRI
jgi:transposase